MNKLELARKCRDLATEVIEPWLEIHGLVLEMDGSHGRIMGLGIKHHSILAETAIHKLAESYEAEYNRELQAHYLTTSDDDTDCEKEPTP